MTNSKQWKNQLHVNQLSRTQTVAPSQRRKTLILTLVLSFRGQTKLESLLAENLDLRSQLNTNGRKSSSAEQVAQAPQQTQQSSETAGSC